ncbi:MAG TPA: N-acetyl-gamma-glutamyl-phosphate reductase, partial [Gemmatimonadales bacterium]|nr:N-acetyl-gamma-glutamyl-phosphate reductase [Gemmatimonadales bacterium]
RMGENVLAHSRRAMKAAVIGAAGYAGGELLRLLIGHPDVAEWVATSRSQAHKPIAQTHPALAMLTDARFAASSPADAARGRDVVFLCLEHGESSRIAREVLDVKPGLVVDLAPDFRVSDRSLYEHYYGPHASPGLLPSFVYGLADILGERLRGARAIATPGCFATAAQLALYPISRTVLAAPPTLFAVTGSSGAGAQPRATTHHPMRAHNLFAYSVLAHRHEAEILPRWREWTGIENAVVRLMTHSGPFVRGIYLTGHAWFGAGGAGGGGVADWFCRAYAGRPFVRLLSQPPELTHAVGTNFALVHVAEGADGREAQIMVAIDNLVKGASGQAIQATNLALGLPETAGLLGGGMYPC